ncbi:hypothetical protein PVT71_14525 [Salipiger sp. H15]|uniref:Carbohydrate-binding protein n=1 Tax=Alloyangia sp. H15 TaxID=3029062 RepID=A0AAU8AN49_9RHOB
MKIIAPIAITDAILVASNIAEDDHAEWDSGTAYGAGDSVIVLATHKVYESVQAANSAHDPTTDDGTWWFEVSATNLWKAFDRRLADQVENSGTITYRLDAGELVTGIAFFNLDAASVRIQVTSNAAVETYDKTVELVDDSDIVDWFSFFTTALDNYVQEALFVDLAAYPEYTIDITIGDGTGTAKVGQIVIGKVLKLGDALEGTTIGLTSYSTKEVDDFGSWTIVPRAKSDPVNFDFAMPASGAGRVKRILNSLRDTPAVYFAGESLVSTHGAMTYGFFQDYEIPLKKAGVSIVQLEIEGLT